MKLLFPRRPRPLAAAGKCEADQKGYVLLVILLVCSLMAIAAAGVLLPVKFNSQRDQEQEMIHRGVQYTRAIRAYYKKFGRYPTKLEDLDNTNQMRFLRKHYKDPLSCKNGKCEDFKLLHYGDPGLSLAGGFGGPGLGATPVGAMNGTNGSSFGANSTFGGNSTLGGNSSFGSNSSPGSSNSSFGTSSGVNSNGVFSQSFGNANNAPGSTSNSQGSSGQQGQSGDQSSPDQAVQQQGSTGATNSNQQVFGGGPIVGVASISKDKTIRLYNKKTKYNEWQFVYDPTADRGGLISTPYQAGLQNFGNNNLNGATPAGQNGTGNSPFGQSSFGQSGQSSFGQSGFGQSGQSGFGQSSGFNSNSNQNNPPSQPPSSNPPQ